MIAQIPKPRTETEIQMYIQKFRCMLARDCTQNTLNGILALNYVGRGNDCDLLLNLFLNHILSFIKFESKNVRLIVKFRKNVNQDFLTTFNFFQLK